MTLPALADAQAFVADDRAWVAVLPRGGDLHVMASRVRVAELDPVERNFALAEEWEVRMAFLISGVMAMAEQCRPE